MIDTSYSLEELNATSKGNMSELMGVEYIQLQKQMLVAQMPVTSKCTQPIGILNGGASAFLAETVGSLAGYLCLNRKTHYSVGLEIKCNHLRPAFIGDKLIATAEPQHLGQRTQLWKIVVENGNGKKISLSTLTIQVLSFEERPEARKMLEGSPLRQFS